MALFGKKKPVDQAETSVIADKETNDKAINEAAPQPATQTPEVELDTQEIGLINNHRANLQVQLHMIELLQKNNEIMQKQLDVLLEISKKA